MPSFDAVVFDLDGVITKTALVHGSAWKKMFDEYLRSREERFGEPFREFTHADDYLPHVDGKPRYKGVADFLESRGISIPYGDPSDDNEKETVCGLGNRKNLLFNRVLDEEGVSVYESTVELIKQLKSAGVRIGVASSSKNCKPVLEAAHLLEYFETRIDGVVSAEIGLLGKPEPDIFTTACDRLGVDYHRAIVVEDAVSGVQAGRKGNFGLTIGVAREENVKELEANGADIVVEDLDELTMEDLEWWFTNGMEEDAWQLKYVDYDQVRERSREALLTVGNGYFGTRGALEESSANWINYPGTYIKGLYNRRTSWVGDREVENEDFVNAPNWLPVTFRINGGEWLGIKPEPSMKFEQLKRTLDMKKGTLERTMVVTDDQGRRTRVRSLRFAGMHDPHRAGLSYSITPLNYSETLEIRSALSGDHINAGVDRYSDLDQEHLEPVKEHAAEESLQLTVRTSQSGTEIALAARQTINCTTIQCGMDTARAEVSEVFMVEAREGEEILLEKVVALHTGLEAGDENPEQLALGTLRKMGDFREELDRSAAAWELVWKRINVRIEGDRNAQRLVHLHLYHMMVSASPHSAALDAGIPPRGLHGEAYRGHIFWDELYMLPLYNLHYPEVTRATLLYRHRRLGEARKNAREHGYSGAMFPWQSGSDGREETQVVHLNPLSGEWGDDYSSLQRHISLALAYNLWQYYHSTNDRDFMKAYGNELFLDICKFWISKARKGDDGRYHIDEVMGPDEFHEKLPGSEKGGLTDNAYTNLMVSWMLGRASQLASDFRKEGLVQVMNMLGISENDFERWNEVSSKLALHINPDGIVEQFSGYFGLEELDWDSFREKHGDIHRLDRILKAEGKSPDDYKLSKQADLLMIFYNLGNREVTDLVNKLGYVVPGDVVRRNFDYYIARTSHGSTLSRLVHARLAFQSGMGEIAWKLYSEALESDLVDIQGGTTGEGIHCGVMAGTVYDALVSFAGLDLSGDSPVLDPDLPGHWKEMSFGFGFRGSRFQVSLGRNKLKITLEDSARAKIKVHLCEREYEIEKGKTLEISLI